ncbi:MAG: AAA family ATPase [Microthrixaceae bacterium]|nr:AAA family ATPase [Microthrixaceae bacterium]MCO5312009.1 AAA family ATPase [Microthrixaceae bacterium]
MQPERFAELTEALANEVATVIVGQRDLVRDALVCLVTEGHLLIEGVPGLGKTQLVTALAAAAGLDWKRVQFTPDLMPADIVGTQVLVTSDTGARSFSFQPGPVFCSLLLADEINRATPKTQSALLEAMQERRVTAGGETRPLPRPFLVLATQNPIEQEGTYPLPEAQLDRFLLKAEVGMPTAAELTQIIERTTGSHQATPRPVTTPGEVSEMIALTRSVPVPEAVVRFAATIVVATHPNSEGAPDAVRRYVEAGSSPRGAQALILAAKAVALMDGRPSVSSDDIRSVAQPALRHRVALGYDAINDDVAVSSVIDAVVESAATVAL